MKSKIFLTHDGVTDDINGWTKRLDLHPVYFRRRHKLYKNDEVKLFAKRLKPGPITPLIGNKSPSFKHGLSKLRAYQVWCDMLRRCYNTRYKRYGDYGGRGIKVTKAWHNFKNFYRDMGDPPIGRSIDRKNNNKGYSKLNCKWSTRLQQLANRRPYKKRVKLNEDKTAYAVKTAFYNFESNL